MTTYILLHRLDVDPPEWTEIGLQQAASPKAALRQHHESHPIADGAYAAVPERNWTELTPELVTETRLVFR